MPRSRQKRARSNEGSDTSVEEILFWRDEALPMVEGRRALKTRAGYRDHTHPTWSLGIVDAGQSRVRLGSQRLVVSAGDVILIPPGCVHACNPLPAQPWSYRMFYFDAAWVASWWDDCASIPPIVFTDARARRHVDDVESILRVPGDVSHRQRRLAATLVHVLRRARHSSTRRTEELQTGAFERARRLLEQRLVERVSLRELEAAAKLSRYQLIRLFRRMTGLTPHAYQIDRRIHHCRELLKRGVPPADVAHVAGFADQSHFQRAFRPRVAVTPAVYSRRDAAAKNAAAAARRGRR